MTMNVGSIIIMISMGMITITIKYRRIIINCGRIRDVFSWRIRGCRISQYT